jgi:hypothetical protein
MMSDLFFFSEPELGEIFVLFPMVIDAMIWPSFSPNEAPLFSRSLIAGTALFLLLTSP